MAFFDHVLVPHDFSDTADEAVRAAIGLAAPGRGDVTVLHVIAPFYPLRDLTYGSYLLDARALEQQVLARLERRIASLVGRNEVRCLVTTGNPGQRIADAARQASCVVMTTSGRTGAAHALIGSVAERVVRLSPVPVLVLPRSRKRPRRRSHGR